MGASDTIRSLVSELTGVTPHVADVTARADDAPASATDETGIADPVRIVRREQLAQAHGTLTQIDYEQRLASGAWRAQRREVYDHGDSCALLPYDAARGTVLLTRQFRLPPFVREHAPAMLEACAGKLEGASADQRMVEEAMEELGLRVTALERLFSVYVSPASVAEKVTLFLCAYAPADRTGAGGGLAGEGEFIEIVELPLVTALDFIAQGVIMDAKTILLLQALAARLSVGTPRMHDVR
jgi:nudix-type nucleoside diphosphatase (YffH/AdpP family)